MNHPTAQSALFLALCTTVASTATPRETFLVAGTSAGWAEIAGATGYIATPAIHFTPPAPFAATPLGMGASATTGYLLTSNAASPSLSQTLTTIDLATGATTSIPVQLPATDPGLTD